MNIALYLTLAALIGCTWRLYRTKQRAARYYQTLMIVNAILDAAFKSAETKQWEPVMLEVWRGKDDVEADSFMTDYDAEHFLIKEEKMPDGRTKLILKEKSGGKVVQKVVE